LESWRIPPSRIIRPRQASGQDMGREGATLIPTPNLSHWQPNHNERSASISRTGIRVKREQMSNPTGKNRSTILHCTQIITQSMTFLIVRKGHTACGSTVSSLATPPTKKPWAAAGFSALLAQAGIPTKGSGLETTLASHPKLTILIRTKSLRGKCPRTTTPPGKHPPGTQQRPYARHVAITTNLATQLFCQTMTP